MAFAQGPRGFGTRSRTGLRLGAWELLLGSRPGHAPSGLSCTAAKDPPLDRLGGMVAYPAEYVPPGGFESLPPPPALVADG